MVRRRQRRRLWKWLGVGAVAAVALAVAINALVYFGGRSHIVTVEEAEPAQAALVLGARVYPNGGVSPMLADRLETALELYQAGKVRKILVSGDHSRKEYDEVNTMRRYLEERGVPPEDIFMDHAGFDTYDSMYRARAVFAAEDVIVVTQEFHLPRALWIAHRLGLKAQGVVADRHRFGVEDYYEMREMAARLKAFGEVLIRRKPVFLGPVIPITGDGRATHDQV
ncbi:MAG TPA: ElyC/SanA/YdcF family protein [Symbiobacteriaceae bacterium]